MTDQPEISDNARGSSPFVAFQGVVRIASGDLAQVALAAARAQRQGSASPVIVFDRRTGGVADLDLRGTEQETVARYTPLRPAARTRGRPKLGVVAREVTLLPRHWDWLGRQPGGASTALRKLVEAARKTEGGATKARERTEAAYRFMAAVAGDFPGFEEGARRLFADDRERFAAAIAQWPSDIRDELLRFLASSTAEVVTT
jgi:hypothetical protein